MFFYYPSIKRLFDVVFSLVLLVFFSPFLLLTSFCSLLFLGRPIFFIQKRIGLNSKPFLLFKFRSMLLSSESFSQHSDHLRATPYGSVLRATSIDELPSLINILRGDMSFVGPRPLLPEYLPLYTKQQLKRHNVRPGLTGLAQVSGRNSIPWDSSFT